MVRCPRCNAGYRMLVNQLNGSIKCLQCGLVFTIGYGIKYGYPRIPAPEKLRAYAMLVRPFTLLPALIAGLVGCSLPLLASGTPILPHIWTLVFAGVTLALLQAVGQITNQVADAEIDSESKPYRPIPQGLIKKDEAMSIAWILSIFGIARAFTLGITFGLLALAILFFAVFYNLPPRAKKSPWLGNVWLGLSRGFLPFVATWSVFGDLSNTTPYVLGIFAFFWVFALNGTKDYQDIEADQKFGVVTLPVKYGIKKATKIMLGLSLLPFIFLGLVLPFFPNFWWLLIMLLLVPLVFYGLRFTSPVENSWAWVGFYAGLSLIYLLAIPVVS